MLHFLSTGTFEPAFAAGFQAGVGLSVFLVFIYNMKLRKYMPWNQEKLPPGG